MIVLLQNHPIEAPGALTGILDELGVEWRVVHMHAAPTPELDPLDPAIDGVVILGGPMGAHDDTELPWLATEKRFLADFIDKHRGGKPTLGICLGAQLMAEALMHGRAYANETPPEIGWLEIEWTDEALRHPYFRHFPKRQRVFQWHGDTFEPPQGAVRLAGSEAYPAQAFAWGPRVVALQFHLEVTDELIAAWRDAPFNREFWGRVPGGVDWDEQARHTAECLAPAQESLRILLRNLFGKSH